MKDKEDLNYWKANAEEDYLHTPISVLRYITELETAVKNCSIPDVRQQRELLDEFCSTMEFDVKHETYEEDIDYFLENVKADNCA